MSKELATWCHIRLREEAGSGLVIKETDGRTNWLLVLSCCEFVGWALPGSARLSRRARDLRRVASLDMTPQADTLTMSCCLGENHTIV